MHGEIDLAGFDGGGEVRGRSDAGSLRGDCDRVAVIDSQLLSIHWVEVEEEGARIEFSQDRALAGARLGVPLRACAATGQESEGKGIGGGFRKRCRWVEEELCLS
ncbi:MAG: hypothetical protein ACJAVK_002278 [Akkermansiaceae bacterium]